MERGILAESHSGGQHMSQMLQPGDSAPEFAVTDHTGKTVHLSDFRGRNVVLWFFPKADTPG
jgi:peroxiredoxin Q/BCP